MLSYMKRCDSPVIVSLLDKQHSHVRPGLFVVIHLDNCPGDVMEKSDITINIDDSQNYNTPIGTC